MADMDLNDSANKQCNHLSRHIVAAWHLLAAQA